MKDWKTIAIAVLSMVVGFLIASGGFPQAQAQSEGRTPGVICVVGQERNGDAPIVIVDVPDQSVMVYEYSYSNNRIELTAARTFQFDKLLTDFNTEGYSVDEVRAAVVGQ